VLIALGAVILLAALLAPATRSVVRVRRAAAAGQRLRVIHDAIRRMTKEQRQSFGDSCTTSDQCRQVLIEAGVFAAEELVSPFSRRSFVFAMYPTTEEENAHAGYPMIYEPLTADMHCANILYLSGRVECEPPEIYHRAIALVEGGPGSSPPGG